MGINLTVMNSRNAVFDKIFLLQTVTANQYSHIS